MRSSARPHTTSIGNSRRCWATPLTVPLLPYLSPCSIIHPHKHVQSRARRAEDEVITFTKPVPASPPMTAYDPAYIARKKEVAEKILTLKDGRKLA